MFDKGLIGSATIALWLGLLPVSILWFTLHAISKMNDQPQYRMAERKVLSWIVIRYPIIMLIISLGSWMGRMEQQDFDSFWASVMQNPNEVVAILIWIVAAAMAILFIIFRPPFRKAKGHETEPANHQKNNDSQDRGDKK